MPRRGAYWPGLDGLRAAAVIAVLLWHGDVSAARGGFLGVDIFFVLSGFLITFLLLGEHRRNGRVDFRGFWSRRARRLLPAFLLVLFVVLLATPLLVPAEQRGSLHADALASLGYVLNWRFVATDHAYFHAFGAPSPLLHLWSLSVEEQFYLLWPALLVGAFWLLRGRNRLTLVVTAAAVACAGWTALLAHSSSARVYYATDTRAVELLTGAVLACVIHLRPKFRMPGAVGLAALAGLAVCVWRAPTDTVWLARGGFVLVALLTIVVIAAAISPHPNVVRRALSTEPLVLIGLLSYGIYLWHWPVYLFLSPTRTHLPAAPLLFVRIAVTVAAAALSMRFVEAPIRKGRLRNRPAVTASFAGATALALVCAIALYPAPAQHPDLVAARASGAAAAPGLAFTPPSTRPAPERILLIGDSVAETIGSGFESEATRLGVHLRDDGVLGCGLVPVDRARRGGQWQTMPAQCAGEAARIDARVKAYSPDVVLMLFDVWDVLDSEVDGRVIAAGSPEADRRITDQLRRLVDDAASHGASVVILTAPYNGRGRTAPQVKWEEDDPARVDHFNAVLREFARARPEVRIADLNQFTAPARVYTNSLLGVRLRYDGVHFNHAAGELAFAWLWPQLQHLPAPHR